MKIENTIYLDHQASTPVDPRVMEAMMPYWRGTFANPHSTEHVLGQKAALAVLEAQTHIACLIGAQPQEIIFTSGATEANNLAILGLARRFAKGSRKRVLFSAIEHKSVLATQSTLQTLGYSVELIPVDRHGRIDLLTLASMLDEHVLLASVMAVNNEIGTIQDMETISTMLHKVGAIFHCDAAQAPCAIDMRQMANLVDMLSLSGHKIYAPKGIGALFVRHELENSLEPLIYGGGQQQGLRAGTLPVALCVGFGEAASILLDEEYAKAERRRWQKQAQSFMQHLERMPWPIYLNGPPIGPMRHPGNINVCFTRFHAQDILGVMQPFLAASTGSACSSGAIEPSDVLQAIGLSRQKAMASIRFGIGRYTHNSDLDEAILLLQRALERLEDESIFL